MLLSVISSNKKKLQELLHNLKIPNSTTLASDIIQVTSALPRKLRNVGGESEKNRRDKEPLWRRLWGHGADNSSPSHEPEWGRIYLQYHL